jgi:hypothetical protein
MSMRDRKCLHSTVCMSMRDRKCRSEWLHSGNASFVACADSTSGFSASMNGCTDAVFGWTQIESIVSGLGIIGPNNLSTCWIVDDDVYPCKQVYL